MHSNWYLYTATNRPIPNASTRPEPREAATPYRIEAQRLLKTALEKQIQIGQHKLPEFPAAEPVIGLKVHRV